MRHIVITVREWWQPPRKASETPEDRSVSFLELFYDLVYVVIIAQLTHSLIHADINVTTILKFAALFSVVWFAWVNGAFYHELHGNNDLRTRIFTFIQMFPLAGIGIFIHDAFNTGYSGFALSYAGYLAVLTYLWWRTGVYDQSHKPISQPYSIAFVFTTIAFVVSAFVPPPTPFYIWGGAIVFSLVLPIVLQTKTGKDNGPCTPRKYSTSTAFTRGTLWSLYYYYVR